MSDHFSIARDHFRSGPTIANQSKPEPRPTQPSDGPGVIWFRDRPWCVGCNEPLTPTCGEYRPPSVPCCPVCVIGGAA